MENKMSTIIWIIIVGFMGVIFALFGSRVENPGLLTGLLFLSGLVAGFALSLDTLYGGFDWIKTKVPMIWDMLKTKLGLGRMQDIVNSESITWADYGKLALLAGGIVLGCALIVKAISFVIGLVAGVMLRILINMQGIDIGGF